MPKYSKQSAGRLSTCDPRLQDVFNEVIKHFDCSVLQGHRGEIEQNEGVKLRWGGDWNQDRKSKDEKLFDGPHFEIIGD